MTWTQLALAFLIETPIIVGLAYGLARLIEWATNRHQRDERVS